MSDENIFFNVLYKNTNTMQKKYKKYIWGLRLSIRNYYEKLTNKKKYNSLCNYILKLKKISQLDFLINIKKITINIDNLLYNFGYILLQTDRCGYHTSIFITNIKRWNKILGRYELPNLVFYKILKIFKWFINNIYFKYRCKLSNDISDLYQDLSLVFSNINKSNLNDKKCELVYISIKYNKPNMIDHLKYIFNFPQYFNLNIISSTKGYKILKLLNAKNIIL